MVSMRVVFCGDSAQEVKVNVNPSNPADLSLEAALELEEVKQHIRVDSPALSALLHFIRTPLPAFNGESISMLADARAYPLLRDSIHIESGARDFRKIIEQYLNDLEDGVARADLKKIDEAKRFCIALNTQILAKDMGEFFARREGQDSRNN
jgi:hypothetical protein